jgi:3-dehydroquinate synthetase
LLFTYNHISFICLHLSLLAMVDSSIGGKTAIDVPEGKNLIGAFHHPHAVCIDVAFLQSLPIRHLSNGMAEVIKMAAALDADFFGWLENAQTAHLFAQRDVQMLLHCVNVSGQLKATIIDQDERDGAQRNILNVGHTVGHAIEAVLAPSWLHGECVSVVNSSSCVYKVFFSFIFLPGHHCRSHGITWSWCSCISCVRGENQTRP